MKNVYAGIGSRETPPGVLEVMVRLAYLLSTDHWFLRTGNAPGADQAWSQGANKHNPKTVGLYLPWPSFEQQAILPGNTVLPNPSMEAVQLTAQFHPTWERCGRGARALHARNAHILLGKNLDSPVKFVLAWYNPMKQGGTQQGIRIAQGYGIPSFNMFGSSEYDTWDFIRKFHSLKKEGA